MSGNQWSSEIASSRVDSRPGAISELEIWFGAASRGINLVGAFAFLPAMTAVMMIEVVARYVFNSPFMWTYEIASHLLLLVFLCGIVECTRTGGHIRMDLIYLVLPDNIRKTVRLIYYLFGIGIFALVIKHAGGEIPYLYSVPVLTEYSRIPEWVFYAVLVFISLMMIGLFLMRIAQIAAAVEDERERGSH